MHDIEGFPSYEMVKEDFIEQEDLFQNLQQTIRAIMVNMLKLSLSEKKKAVKSKMAGRLSQMMLKQKMKNQTKPF